MQQWSQKKHSQPLFQQVNYLTQLQLEEYLSQYQLNQPDFILSFYRKSQGSIKNIQMLLQQMFQHSGWISPQVVLYTTLEQV